MVLEKGYRKLAGVEKCNRDGVKVWPKLELILVVSRFNQGFGFNKG